MHNADFPQNGARKQGCLLSTPSNETYEIQTKECQEHVHCKRVLEKLVFLRRSNARAKYCKGSRYKRLLNHFLILTYSNLSDPEIKHHNLVRKRHTESSIPCNPLDMSCIICIMNWPALGTTALANIEVQKHVNTSK